MSQQALDLIAIAKKNRATRLDIGNCNLTELPDELFELTWLEELSLSNSYGGGQLGRASNENKNNIEFLSPKLIQLQSLKNLILKGDFFSSWNLCELNSLEGLLNLQKLDIRNTKIRDLTPLTFLINLEELRVSSSYLNDTSLIALKHLTNLRSLEIGSLLVTNLEPLKGLFKLQNLSVHPSMVEDLTPLKDLISLTSLDISNNYQVSDLNPIKNLVNLKSLNLAVTKIDNIYPLKYLINLKELNFFQNSKLLDLSPLQNLMSLESVGLNNTQVTDLSPLKKIIEKGVLVDLYGINVENSPISNPPYKTVKKGNAAILRYWAEQDRVGLKKVNEARLLLVGQGASGKTTLKDKLTDCNAPMPEHDATTKGIVIQPLIYKNREGSDFTVQVWDFGGQNIQKYAHQFFMSDSVVYAVLSNTREQNPNFQYWLNIIELLGKDSPFFIVQNEKDGHAESLKDITQIQERFPHTFKSVEQVNLKNAATDPRFDMLKQRLFFAATQLPHTQKEYLVSFVNVREKLAVLSHTQQTITFKEFKKLCKDEGIEDPELMNDYARTFTLLGIALHFADDVFLKTQVFLRPKWLIDALFAVLYAQKVEDQNGKFSAADAETIWHEEEYDDMHGILLQLMVRFHLCYALPNTTDYIVPQRLPTRTAPFVPSADATHIVYRYRFLPSGILTQLTCRLHARIEDDKVWNDAVQFSTKNGQARVFVRENSADNHLELFAWGEQKAELINLVVDTLDEIHQNSKFGNLKVEKLVPCPCAVCAAKRAKQEEAGFFEYDLLIQDLQNGDTESDKCRFSRKKFPIRDILKNASIRILNIEQIRKLLGDGKTGEALNILRGVFAEDDEVIMQLSRLSHLNRGDRTGQLSFDEANRERTKIIQGVLGLLREWEGQ